MKSLLHNTLTDKQERGLAVLQQEPELFAELVSEVTKEKKMSPAQRVHKEDLTQDLMEQGFSREAAERLSVF